MNKQELEKKINKAAENYADKYNKTSYPDESWWMRKADFKAGGFFLLNLIFDILDEALSARIHWRKIDLENKKLKKVLEEIAEPTFGTEFITYNKDEYKENYHIICDHLYSKQDLARKILNELNK